MTATGPVGEPGSRRVDPALDWDPLYLPRVRMPGTGAAQRFADLDAEVTVTDTAPDTVEAQWMPDRAIELVIDDRHGPEALARALPVFRAYAAALADRGATAMITLPSRDVDRCRVARENGFTARSVLAVCPLPRPAVVPNPLPTGVTVRRAEPRDGEDIAALRWSEAEYEARLGELRFSPAIAAAMAAQVPELIAGPGRVVVADRGGRAVSVVIAGSPAASAWAATRLRVETVSYVALASTAADQRGIGLGGALVRDLHRHQAAEGVQASVLHYSVHNPLSVPFWSQQGYRPVLTTLTRPL